MLGGFLWGGITGFGVWLATEQVQAIWMLAMAVCIASAVSVASTVSTGAIGIVASAATVISAALIVLADVVSFAFVVAIAVGDAITGNAAGSLPVHGFHFGVGFVSFGFAITV